MKTCLIIKLQTGQRIIIVNAVKKRSKESDMLVPIHDRFAIPGGKIVDIDAINAWAEVHKATVHL